MRGIYAARVLEHIAGRFGGKMVEQADLVAGTSTGALLAAGVACGISGQELVKIYLSLGERVFRYRWWSFCGLLCSQYNNERLKQALQQLFGDRRLGDVERRLALPVMNLTHGMPVVLRSDIPEHQHIPLWLAVQAACAAQSFFDPCVIDGELFCDAGLWAYDPALSVVMSEYKERRIPWENFRIVSLGSGIGEHFYPVKERGIWTFLGWGLAMRWRIQRLINIVLNIQGAAAAEALSAVVDDEQMFRFNFRMNHALALDDSRDLAMLTRQADKDFAEEGDGFRDWLTQAWDV